MTVKLVNTFIELSPLAQGRGGTRLLSIIFNIGAREQK